MVYILLMVGAVYGDLHTVDRQCIYQMTTKMATPSFID